MGSPDQKCNTESRTSVLFPSPTPRTLSQRRAKANGKIRGEQNLLNHEMRRGAGAAINPESEQSVFTHGLRHVQHFPCDSPVRHAVWSGPAGAIISLHTDGTVQLCKDGGLQQSSTASSPPCPFMGLTATKGSGHLVGWGPGPIFTLVDSELHPLRAAREALDVRVCQAAEHSAELVTAGVGNVCVWSVVLMRCKVKILEGLQHGVFNQMALASPRPGRPHRAFVACGRAVTAVDLDAGKVLEHKRNLCLRGITALVYCSQRDCLIVASQEPSIRVLGPDWEIRAFFIGHNGVVKSMLYCSEVGVLISASTDCTIRCWDVEEGQVQCVQTEKHKPAVHIGSTGKRGTFFSFSHQGVDLWSVHTLYNRHCKIGRNVRVPLRQIVVPPSLPPYPTRVLCVSGDSDLLLVAAETGAVLTSFRANQRILCADYCLHKEILVALTESGTVLLASALTNPSTLMEEWQGRGLGPWQQENRGNENEVENLSSPGPASCLALYSYVPDSEGALREWRRLQEHRGRKHRSKEALGDANNKFFVMLGQRRGCVSVLNLGNGELLYRTPAHNGTRVTTVQAYPQNSCLLSAGEDKTVVVWTVNPYVQEILSQQVSLYSDQPALHLAALGSCLALTLQEPNSAAYSLRHFNLLSRSWTERSSVEGHSDCTTGLCVCPELEVFVSSSLDGTICIWNEENRLIRTLQLNAEPECVAYSGSGGVLFLGIRGDLYRMNCAKFLPYKYQQQLLCDFNAEPIPDLPIQIKAKHSIIKMACTSKKEEEQEGIVSNPLYSEDMWNQYESVVARNKDLAALLEGTLKCTRLKPARTAQTQKEAFDNYMKIIYGNPTNFKIGLEDMFDSEPVLVYHEPYDKEICSLPTLDEDCTLDIPVNLETRQCQKQQQQTPTPARASKPKILPRPKPRPVAVADQVKQPVIEKNDAEPPKQISPREQPKPKTPTPTQSPSPSPSPRSPTPPPPRTPTPEVPAFLKQFAEEGWFRDLYRDHKCISSTLSAEDFSLQLLDYLNICNPPSKILILAALRALHSQGLLRHSDKFYQGVVNLVRTYGRPGVSHEERSMFGEMLNLLVLLKPDSCDLIIKLLTILAHKDLGLREEVLCVLSGLGVREADRWLWSELEIWDWELQNQSDVWKSLHDRADSWLELWTSKYKEHSRQLYPDRTAKWKLPNIPAVDVLNYFCSFQKEENLGAQSAAPAGRKDTVLLPIYDCSSQPIHRLGESYTMARIRKPPGLVLPPLRNRPFLMGCPSFVSFPLPRVSLCLFPALSDQQWLTASTRRYFIQQQSHVDYYR